MLLPDGSRSWYIRADTVERSYQAQLGLTLPSGEFRSLADSNVVRTPRTGPAHGGAPRRARYRAAPSRRRRRRPRPAALLPATAAVAACVFREGSGPWRPDPSTMAYPGPGGGAAERPRPGQRPGEPSGGASDRLSPLAPGDPAR